MKNLFVPYELAVMAKEKMIDIPCLGVYHHSSPDLILSDIPCVYNYDFGNINGFLKVYDYVTTAPTYQQLVDWFDEMGIDIEKPKKCELGYLPHIYKDRCCIWQGDYFTTKQIAYNASIKHAFTLLP